MRKYFLPIVLAFFCMSCTVDENLESPKGNPDDILPPGSDEEVWHPVEDYAITGDELDALEAFFASGIINLDYAGLEKVRQCTETEIEIEVERVEPDPSDPSKVTAKTEKETVKNYYGAAIELIEYFRDRNLGGKVLDPEMPPLGYGYTEADKNKADQATVEGGYRFCVSSYVEREGATDSEDTFYSFLAQRTGADGKPETYINWDFWPTDLFGNENEAEQWNQQKHRMQWVLPQARTYYQTRDEKYARAWMDVLGSWIDRYPYPVAGENGVSDPLWYQPWYALQGAERLIDNLHAFMYFVHSPNMTPAWIVKFLNSVKEHADYLINYRYSAAATAGRYSSNINLSQDQALFYAGIFFPEYTAAPEWQATAGDRMRVHIENQFNDDGCQNEMDLSYHIGVVSNFISIYNLARDNGIDPHFDITKLQKPVQFIMDMVHPSTRNARNWNVENFNDTRSATYNGGSKLTRNFKGYLSYFSSAEDADFYSALEYMADQNSNAASLPVNLKLYSTSGYYMFRSGWEYDDLIMILKNNDKAGRDLKHCQNDNNTFSIFKGGRRFFPDAGVYQYSDNDKVKELEAAERHNTLVKTGANFRGTIATAAGTLKSSGTATTADRHNYEYLVTENQSYSDLKHRRTTFFVEKKFFVIVDEAFYSSTMPGAWLSVNFHLADKASVAQVKNTEASHSSAFFSTGAYTYYTDGNNMLCRTFAAKDSGISADFFDSDYSDAINRISGTRQAYRVRKSSSQAKPNDPNPTIIRYITVIAPFGTFDQSYVDDMFAEFTGASASASDESLPVTVTVTMPDMGDELDGIKAGTYILTSSLN